jgi:hypothetical protein
LIAGFVWWGIIPGRPYDRLGIGVYWLKESNDLDDQPGNLLQDEVGFEAFYNLALTPWAQLSFDVQWIDPGVNNHRRHRRARYPALHGVLEGFGRFYNKQKGSYSWDITKSHVSLPRCTASCGWRSWCLR